MFTIKNWLISGKCETAVIRCTHLKTDQRAMSSKLLSAYILPMTIWYSPHRVSFESACSVYNDIQDPNLIITAPADALAPHGARPSAGTSADFKSQASFLPSFHGYRWLCINFVNLGGVSKVLLNLRALKISMLYKNGIVQCMSQVFLLVKTLFEAPSHYLDQYWLIISEPLLHVPEGDFTEL